MSMSPALVHGSTAFEDFSDESFCEVIGALFLSWHADDLNVAVSDVIPKMMPFYVVVFSPSRDSVFGCQRERAIIILMDSGADAAIDRLEMGRDINIFLKFEQHFSNGNKNSHASTQG